MYIKLKFGLFKTKNKLNQTTTQQLNKSKALVVIVLGDGYIHLYVVYVILPINTFYHHIHFQQYSKNHQRQNHQILL